MPYRTKGNLPLCKKPGIYSITNKNNGKLYIGSAMSIYGRLYMHRCQLRSGQHPNIHLQRGWDKHGEQAFRFEVVELCDPVSLLTTEQKWMDHFQSYDDKVGYNISKDARNAMGGRKHTAESKQKMSKSQAGKDRSYLREANKGRDISYLTVAAAKANKGRKMSDEVKKKISDSHQGMGHDEAARANIRANHWSKRPDAAEISERSASKQRGKKHSAEHKEKISRSLYKFYENN